MKPTENPHGATLLEKARSVDIRRQGKWTQNGDEELELMVALVKSEITSRQAAIALGKEPSSRTMYMAYRCFAALRDGFTAGKITIEYTKNGKP